MIKLLMKKKILNEILKQKNILKLIINNYPNTDYAHDSKYKLEYIS